MTDELKRPEAYASTFADRKRAFIVRTGRKLRPIVNNLVSKSSLVPDVPVSDVELFPWTRLLEDNWEAIRDEAMAILKHRDVLPPLHEISPDHRRIANDDSWKSYFLWGYGYRVDANCARCPETTRVVEQVPGLKSALFSILAPHSGIPRHKGVTKGMMTCHLGLSVPKEREKCWIQVHDQTLLWTEGKTMVFDDTYKHEVWNETDEERVVLLVQFARPLKFPGSLVAGAFMGALRHSPFIQEAKRNVAAWDEKLREATTR